MAISDDAFEQYAQEQEKIAREANSRSGPGSSATYEKIEYTGLESNRMKLIRAVGGPPDSKIDNFTARSCRVSWFIGDDGKKFRVVLPERGDDADHILWRIIARVKAVEWVDKKKVYPVEIKHPEIFNIIAHNGFREGDKQFIFDRGWEGQQRLVMNVIDREQMEWHKKNKHTMLLSRSIGEGKDGTKFPEEGVPSWGFSALLANLFKYYKSWERYDIGIIRTGLKETPYRIINAGKYFEEVPDFLKEFVVQEPLNEEEASWERYDLNKLFGVTHYTKIYNKLKLTIARIDAALGSHFLQEMEDKVAKEKVEFEAQKAAEKPAETAPDIAEAPIKETTIAGNPIGTRSAPVRAKPATAFDTSVLKGWERLSSSEKEMIAGVTVKDGKLIEIQYSDPSATLLACPECSIPGPDSFTTCPSCGMQFS